MQKRVERVSEKECTVHVEVLQAWERYCWNSLWIMSTVSVLSTIPFSVHLTSGYSPSNINWTLWVWSPKKMLSFYVVFILNSILQVNDTFETFFLRLNMILVSINISNFCFSPFKKFLQLLVHIKFSIITFGLYF